MTTYIDGPDSRIRAVFIKAHLKMLSVGMTNSQYSGLAILKKASAITGKPYKRGQYEAALKDISALVPFSPVEIIHIKDSTQ
jgi:hypothetical protein